MPTDFLTLVCRDHSDLQHELTQLLDPTATVAQLRSSLDGVRLGLTAHAEAEDIVLARFELMPELAEVVARTRSAHLAQEHALGVLVRARPGTSRWREQALHLRDLVRDHADQEEQVLIPSMIEVLDADAYGALAGAFATERLRQLSMMQPSAPVFMPYVLAQSRAS